MSDDVSRVDVEEVKALVEKLKKKGEFEALLTPEAIEEAEANLALLDQADYLTDQDVERLLQHLPAVEELGDDELTNEVKVAIERAQAHSLEEDRFSTPDS